MALPKFSPAFLVITGIAAFFMFLAVLFNIISLGSNNWYIYEIELIQFNSGLWKTCISGQCHTLSESDADDWFKAVRALLILPILLVLIVAPIFVVGMALKKGLITFIAVLLVGIQGVMVAIAMIIFTSETYNNNAQEHLAWSYVLGWISMIFYGISGLALALATVVLFNRLSHYNIIS